MKGKRSLIIFICLFSFFSNSHAQIITTIVGNGTAGFIDGVPATAAEISNACCIYVDSIGNMYLSARNNGRVRMVNTSGIISTIAGNGIPGFSGDSMAATQATINDPWGVVTDANGNVYFSDYNNYRMRKIDTAGVISTVAGTGSPGSSGDGGPATAARFNGVMGVAMDQAGSLYLADSRGIRKISPATGGTINIVVGGGPGGLGDGGPATAATLSHPYDVALDGLGNMYIADFANNRIREVDATGMISTVAGNGTAGYTADGIPATAAELNGPAGVAIDGCGNIYIADEASHRVRMVNTARIISTIAGNGTPAYGGDYGPATAALLRSPSQVKVDKKGNIFISDFGNNRIRKITTTNRPPYFANGHSQSFTICSDSTISVDSLLAVIDSDLQQGETWSVLSSPVHGTLAAGYTTISTGGKLIPSALSYSTSGGYTGNDSFKVVISDCADLHDTTTVYVTVKPCDLAIGSLRSSNESLTLYPNPNNGTFNLFLLSVSTGEAHVVITNLMGTVVKEIAIPVATGVGKTIAIQLDSPPGVYFCNVITTAGNYREKVCISR